MAIFVLTVVGLMLAASAVNAEQVNDFRMCRRNTSCDVYDVFIDPCPEALYNQTCELLQTMNASIAFKYKPKFGSTLPKTRLYVEILSWDLPLMDMYPNACLYTSCPMVKDTEQNWLYNVFISENYPKARYTVKFMLWDNEPNAPSVNQCCFKFDVMIV